MIHSKSYQKLFNLLLEDNGNISYHCSAGKDRTGITTFLIMMAVGMTEEEGMKEYLLFNTYLSAFNEIRYKKLNISEAFHQKASNLLGVQKESLELTISAIKQKHGNYDEYFEKEFYLTKEKREVLRKLLCE